MGTGWATGWATGLVDRLAPPLAALGPALGSWLQPALLPWSAAVASLPSWLQEPARTLPWLLLAMATLTVLLGLGRAIGQRLQLKRVGIPEALVAGLIGLALAPSGPLPCCRHRCCSSGPTCPWCS